jgi:hypothetical protein
MKLMIFIGIGVVGTVGAWIGAAMDHGNWFGFTSIILGGVGSLAGVWVGYKAGKYLGL